MAFNPAVNSGPPTKPNGTASFPAISPWIWAIFLIIGGALGNIIDSTFYGVIFQESSIFHGKVVDMLYFPLTGESYFLPEWIPYFGGDHFIFFRPIFNIADSAIFVGIISILLFYRNKFA